MRDYLFTVTFDNDKLTVYTSCKTYAIILAQAERIKDGKTIDVQLIRKVTK